jgi:ketosteroid isomerase-like protein
MAGEPTGRDHVEILRFASRATRCRDLDGLVALLRSDVVYDLSDLGLGTFSSVDAVRAFLKGWWEPYTSVEWIADEMEDLGAGVVLTTNTHTARLQGSSEPMRYRDAYVLRITNGQVERLTAYRDADQARAAAERLAEERG